ncbi:MAG: hypothetical protein M1820_001072 [Bogoriella megaspora]|nr:MAG: hypothetical protein M1820_001072 [Bogoriella megaspora]
MERTPENPGASSRDRFESKNAEDVLKSQTAGLVPLDQFRKRRAEAQQGHDSSDGTLQSPRSLSPGLDSTIGLPSKKKKKRAPAKSNLSFDVDDEVDANQRHESNQKAASEKAVLNKRLGLITTAGHILKDMTTTAKLKDARDREKLMIQFMAEQERVKETEIIIPFHFYDGQTSIARHVRLKKKDSIRTFLDQARKVRPGKGRIDVDDMMLVVENIIIPHHLSFHYFIMEEVRGAEGLIFNYSKKPTTATPSPAHAGSSNDASIYRPEDKKAENAAIPDEDLEGYGGDSSKLRIVTVRWYQENKHRHPFYWWKTFDEHADYTKPNNRDAEGNKLFFQSS